MIFHKCRQRSEQWERLRLGIPTASEFHKIVTPKGKLSTQAEKYMCKLLAEWMFGAPLEDPQSSYQSQWMERGAALEQQAVNAYEFQREVETEEIGFVTTDDGMIGCSPDRLIGEDGLLEIKCPAPSTHAGYMLTGSLEDDYVPQLQGELLVCGRRYVDICSHCPVFPEVIIRVERDDRYQAALTEALASFVAVMLKGRQSLTERYGDFRRVPPPLPPSPEFDSFCRPVV
jgi:YqaJ-like viral recombinase domain